MKRVKLETITTIEGKPFRIPETDSDGQAILENDKPKMKEASLVDLLRLFIFNLPPAQLTMQDSIEAHRLFDQIKKATDGFLPIEEAEHDWLKKKLEDVGPKIFGISACMIKNALDNFERLHEPKNKAGKTDKAE